MTLVPLVAATLDVLVAFEVVELAAQDLHLHSYSLIQLNDISLIISAGVWQAETLDPPCKPVLGRASDYIEHGRPKFCVSELSKVNLGYRI